jgi:hypothetical protein
MKRQRRFHAEPLRAQRRVREGRGAEERAVIGFSWNYFSAEGFLSA